MCLDNTEYLQRIFAEKIEEATALEWNVTANIDNWSAFVEFEREGVKVKTLVFDLRCNPGIDILAEEYVPLIITHYIRHLELKRNREREVEG